MTYTRAIGLTLNKVIMLIVRGLALSKIHPNVLTFLRLALAVARFFWPWAVPLGGVVIIGADCSIWWTARSLRNHSRHALRRSLSIRSSTAIRIWLC
jgi:hypothetical protein